MRRQDGDSLGCQGSPRRLISKDREINFRGDLPTLHERKQTGFPKKEHREIHSKKDGQKHITIMIFLGKRVRKEK